MVRSCAVLLLAAFCWLSTLTPAWAQPDPGQAGKTQDRGDDPSGAAPPPEEEAEVSEADKAEARAHFKRGLKLLRQEAWSPALAEFLRSRELYPTRVATNNAAVALRKLQRYDEALAMYETLLRNFDVPPAEREAAQKEIAELRELVGTIELRGAVPGASIVVGGVDRGEFPPVEPLRVPAGNHVVRVLEEGYEPFETRVDVAGGEIAEVEVTMPELTASGKLKVVERTGKTVSVLVDGVAVGVTPWTGTLGVGEHVVQLRGSGKLGSQPARAVVESRDLATLTLLAEELEAQLRVDPTPPGATVSIDGVEVGNGVWLGRLRTGRHRIVVSADGFETAERQVSLKVGQRKQLSVELDRDEDAPRWRKPSRWTFDFGAGVVVLPSFGGELADSCEEGCSAPPGVGGLALLHAGYELGSGLGFGIEAGYFLAAQEVTGRSAALQPNGLTVDNAGTADDSLRLQGFMAGANIGYRLDQRVPVVLRTGAGVLVGQMRDERTGTFQTRDGQTYSTFPVVSFPSATYFYVDPVFRLGYRLSDHVELTGYVQALLLIGLEEPRFDDSIALAASDDGIGTYRDESLMGSFVVGVTPGINLRYDFE